MRFWLTLYGLLLVAFLLLAHEWVRLPDDRLNIAMLDVGQGDSILITTPGHLRILVDGGPDLSLLERLGEELPFFARRIDLLVLTHPDADHITALPAVLARYDVKKVLLSGIDVISSNYAAFLDALRASGAEILIAEADHDLDLGQGVMLDILWPRSSLFGQEMKDVNNTSIVAKLTWKNQSILLTGDIQEDVEEELLKEGNDLAADILKVPHHGSKTSSSTGFLLAVHPQLALISVGRDNAFGHPHPEVLARYSALGIPVQRTDQRNTLHVVLTDPVLP